MIAAHQNLNGSRDWPRPFHGWFAIPELEIATINLSSKFEVFVSPTTKIYKAIENVDNRVVWGSYGH